MVTKQHTDGEQHTLWNGSAGHAWVVLQESLDRMFEPFRTLLVEAAFAAAAGSVLDVGCGTGDTTLALARRLGGGSTCVGIDISDPMIATARDRAGRENSPARFIVANAQSHAFEPASFDMIVSRFGVMFFDDPVLAFANLRRAARADAELRFIAWRGAGENPFMTTAERAAASLLPNLPARRPDGPGQFGFADERRVRRILDESGWRKIDIQPIDVDCALPEKELVPYLTRLGPVGSMLQQMESPNREQVVATVRAAFDPYVRGAEVRFTAACWMVSARAPSASA